MLTQKFLIAFSQDKLSAIIDVLIPILFCLAVLAVSELYDWYKDIWRHNRHLL